MYKLISTLFVPFSKKSRNIAAKNIIRTNIRELKVQVTETQKQKDAGLVFQKIELLPEFKAAKTILLYWSCSGELPTHTVVEKWSADKEILLPSVQGDELLIKRFSKDQKMKKGCLGIWEPEISENFIGKIDLVIVPGIAFDLKKNRLGRGKGYYDRFFDRNKNIKKWGVCYEFQLLPSIPARNKDVRMDKIITPAQIID